MSCPFWTKLVWWRIEDLPPDRTSFADLGFLLNIETRLNTSDSQSLHSLGSRYNLG